MSTNVNRFDGPDCGVKGCEREVGHIGDHHRSGAVMPVDLLTQLLTVGLLEEPINGSFLSWNEASQIAHRIAPHLVSEAGE